MDLQVALLVSLLALCHLNVVTIYCNLVNGQGLLLHVHVPLANHSTRMSWMSVWWDQRCYLTLILQLFNKLRVQTFVKNHFLDLTCEILPCFSQATARKVIKSFEVREQQSPISIPGGLYNWKCFGNAIGTHVSAKKTRCFATCFLDEQVNRSDLSDAERERHNELSTARFLSGVLSSWYCGLAFTYLPKYGQANLQFSGVYGSVGICCAAVWMFDTSGTISELKQAPTGNNLQMDLSPKAQQIFLFVWTLSHFVFVPSVATSE